MSPSNSEASTAQSAVTHFRQTVGMKTTIGPGQALSRTPQASSA